MACPRTVVAIAGATYSAAMLKTLSVALLVLVSLVAHAQPAAPIDWKEWAPMIGEWEADPTAAGPSGSFTLTPELQGRVLVRKNRADYPATKDQPASRHDDLMIIWREGGATKASYWDNEGHLIQYVARIEGNTFTFLSEPQAKQPRFRLIYTVTGPKAMSLRFEIAPPNAPEAFRPYIRASLHRLH